MREKIFIKKTNVNYTTCSIECIDVNLMIMYVSFNSQIIKQMFDVYLTTNINAVICINMYCLVSVSCKIFQWKA